MKIIHHETLDIPEVIHVSCFTTLKKIHFYPLRYEWGKITSCCIGQ